MIATRVRRVAFAALLLVLSAAHAPAQSPEPPPVRGSPESGLKPGDHVMPFTSTVVTGPYRGMQHCFVCDAKGAQTCLVVFLRKPDNAAAKFMKSLRKHLLGGTKPPLAWFVFLTERGSEAETAHEELVNVLAVKSGLTLLNLTVLADPAGPPGYRVNPGAAATVHVYRRFAVRYNRVWSHEAWTEDAAEAAGKEVLDLMKLVTASPVDSAGPALPPGPPEGWVAPSPGVPAGAPPAPFGLPAASESPSASPSPSPSAR